VVGLNTFGSSGHALAPLVLGHRVAHGELEAGRAPVGRAYWPGEAASATIAALARRGVADDLDCHRLLSLSITLRLLASVQTELIAPVL
jgi:hypothetical protein